jgi:hypothetical protein
MHQIPNFLYNYNLPIVFLLFRSYFVPVFLTHVVFFLAYPNSLGNKMFGCCCCCMNNFC